LSGKASDDEAKGDDNPRGGGAVVVLPLSAAAGPRNAAGAGREKPAAPPTAAVSLKSIVVSLSFEPVPAKSSFRKRFVPCCGGCWWICVGGGGGESVVVLPDAEGSIHVSSMPPSSGLRIRRIYERIAASAANGTERWWSVRGTTIGGIIHQSNASI
jgi:hypothetical protein